MFLGRDSSHCRLLSLPFPFGTVPAGLLLCPTATKRANRNCWFWHFVGGCGAVQSFLWVANGVEGGGDSKTYCNLPFCCTVVVVIDIRLSSIHIGLVHTTSHPCSLAPVVRRIRHGFSPYSSLTHARTRAGSFALDCMHECEPVSVKVTARDLQ